MNQYLVEPSKTLRIHSCHDVLVVGGGTAGVVAAIASARTGADTGLVELNGYLGGTIHGGVCGWHSFYNNWQAYNQPKTQVVRGIPDEMVNRLAAMGASTGHCDNERGYQQMAVVTAVDREAYKLLALEMTEEAGVSLLLHTMVVDVMKNDDREDYPFSVIIESKNGREAILAKRIVDCSGDGDAAFMAGCETVPEPEPYPVGLIFAMAGVDTGKLYDWMKDNQLLEQYAYEKKGTDRERLVRLSTCFYMNKELRREFSEHGIFGIMSFSLHEGELTYINGVNARPLADFSPEEYTRVEMENQRNVHNMADKLISSVPGFENAYISWISPNCGVRRSRVIKCDYDITPDDVESARHFADEIGWYGYHDMAPVKHIRDGLWYGIPYRALLPVKVEHMLVAGRMITSDKTAHMSTRNSVCCMVQGQAAGTAAALSVQYGVSPRELDVEVLRDKLKKDGAAL